MNSNKTCYGPTSRRSFLKMGVLGVSGLSLADVMRLRALAGATRRAPDTSVIFVWLAGGPPHMETYDMKPDAPEDYRGQFSPISTNVPGIDVCELLPMHAKIADKFTLIRSIAHRFNDHGGGSNTIDDDIYVIDCLIVAASILGFGSSASLEDLSSAAGGARRASDGKLMGAPTLAPGT